MFLLQGTARKIHHLFLSYPMVKNFWGELREWLNTNVNIEISLEDREILFSYTSNNELVNYIYAIAKLFVTKINLFPEILISKASFAS